jgi:hypothetical protein
MLFLSFEEEAPYKYVARLEEWVKNIAESGLPSNSAKKRLNPALLSESPKNEEK